MDRTKRDLEALVESQKEQLSRYEKRLKDVVTAYKGLLKEKEALENSFAALAVNKDQATGPSNIKNQNASAATESNTKSTSDTKDFLDTTDKITNRTPTATATADDKNDIQTQISTLMNSLATLSAEKSRMEASFQADKKQLRGHLAQKDMSIYELESKIKANDERAKSSVEEIKAKWIIERQEREKETNNQMLMIRELQKLYADERHLKENIEMQLNNFKTQFASNEAENSRLRELQFQLKESKMQLKQLQVNSKNSTAEGLANNSAMLMQLRQEMQQLKEQHAVAIKGEQKRVLLAEEQSRKQAALHEDRVANLEARLAELSSSVGAYDRLRQQDQQSIQVLKKQLQELERSSDAINVNREIENEQERKRRSSIATHDIVDEINRLKKLLINENAHSANPIDVSKVLSVGADHIQCQEEINSLQQHCEADKLERTQLLQKIDVQKSHISTLQEKVIVLNRNIDEQELELKQHNEKLRQAVKEERTKWKECLAEMENELLYKANDLEQQLQKQRQRSLQLLDEKEQEIKTLQTSFEIFHSATIAPTAAVMQSYNTDPNATSSDAESMDGSKVVQAKSALQSKRLSVGENCHMLHYANEIARKDIEIAGLRKAKYTAETSLRRAIQEKVGAQEVLGDKIDGLEEQVDRLQRCMSREGANLEYLKNVIISFIVTKDAEGKRHMMNAISAVLQFTPTEIQIINEAFPRK